jgi:glycosyltransferase involved in cell wall biosynthesis
LTSAQRTRVLVLLDYFLPGEKAGGPVRTLAALLHHLGDRIEFRVVTRNRDLGDPTPYALPTGRWVEYAGTTCRYLRRAERSPWAIARLLRSTPHDVLYLNGFFSIPFILTPLALQRSGVVPRRPVIVAPRGQLDRGALALKPRKKRLFLAAVRASGMFADVEWQATSDHEVEAIRGWFGSDAAVHVAPNLRIPPVQLAPAPRRDPAGTLRVVFLSRISPMKNLTAALEILAGVQAPIIFDIYGAREDVSYWRRVEHLLRALPAHVRAAYCGVVVGAAVHETLRTYDVLLLPTFGENYGHVIAEALAAGCAPLISDRTPWRNLSARGVGWDFPLDDKDAFRAVLERCARETPAERWARGEAGARWMASIDSDPARVEANARLFGVPTGSPEAGLGGDRRWTTRAHH